MPQVSNFINASVAESGRFSLEVVTMMADAKIEKNKDFRAGSPDGLVLAVLAITLLLLGVTVLPRLKWDKSSARISYSFERRFPHVQEDPKAVHGPGERRHPSAPSPRTHSGLQSL
jgi:hypothetical protein